MPGKKEKPPRGKVTLKKKHRHGGKNYKANDIIQVTADEKAWLERHEVI